MSERQSRANDFFGYHATAIALSRGAKMHKVLLDGARRDGEIGDDNKICAKLSANEEGCLIVSVVRWLSVCRILVFVLTKIRSCDDRSAALLGLQDQLIRFDAQRLSELFEDLQERRTNASCGGYPAC